MIVFHADRVISRDQAAMLKEGWQRALEAGQPFILPPGWKIEQLSVPAISGPLADYIAQLGDA